jgi:hypothetical protein
MVIIERPYLAVRTSNDEDAGTRSYLNLTINIDGSDVVDYDLLWRRDPSDSVGIERGEAAIFYIRPEGGGPYEMVDPFESMSLTPSSIRLGIRAADDWHPEHVLLLGSTLREMIPLAVEVDQTVRLSTNDREGHLSMPVRPVSQGNSTTVIRRVLLLVSTDGWNDNAGTDDPIELQITAGGGIVLQQQIHDTPQPDLEKGCFNWYGPFEAAVPFTRSDVASNGGIQLRILGDNAWKPSQVLVYGFDTADGRPTEIVSLVAPPFGKWDMGWLSTDPNEGEDHKDLPVI